MLKQRSRIFAQPDTKLWHGVESQDGFAATAPQRQSLPWRPRIACTVDWTNHYIEAQWRSGLPPPRGLLSFHKRDLNGGLAPRLREVPTTTVEQNKD
jgi:hypothetical protein